MPLRWMLLGLTFALCACQPARAPEDAGVCWRVRQDSSGAVRFQPLAHDVGNLETCAVLLEGLRLKGEAEPDGAYQGYFILVDASAVRSGPHLTGLHYPVFQPPQRAAIDRDLGKIMKSHGGRLPDASELSLERK
jgi:hypothetical protein